jgi:putative oxidoreductase
VSIRYSSEEFFQVMGLPTAIQSHAHNTGLLWLRLLAGIGIATHGYSKIFGERMAGFTEGVAEMGFPAPVLFAWAAALSELVGGILIALGLGTRWAALLVFITMSVALFIRQAGAPFERRELAFLYFAISGAVCLIGAGRFALDKMLCRGNFQTGR